MTSFTRDSHSEEAQCHLGLLPWRAHPLQSRRWHFFSAHVEAFWFLFSKKAPYQCLGETHSQPTKGKPAHQKVWFLFVLVWPLLVKGTRGWGQSTWWWTDLKRREQPTPCWWQCSIHIFACHWCVSWRTEKLSGKATLMRPPWVKLDKQANGVMSTVSKNYIIPRRDC